jgi:hypothetical protein
MAPRIMRERGENEEEMRRGRHSFILGREEKPLLDELQVSHIQERETKSRKRHF